MSSQELNHALWNAADVMRGSMSANEYKDYLLGLVFYKYLSDHQLYIVVDNLENRKPESLEEAQELYEETYKKRARNGFTAEELTAYSGKYQNVVEELKQVAKADTDAVMDVNVEYKLENIMSTKVDYRYIVALIQKYVPTAEIETESPIQDTVINEKLQKLHETNAPLTDIIQALWNDIKQNPAQFRGQIVEIILEGYIDKVIGKLIQKFTEEWATDAKGYRGYYKYL